MLLSRRGFALSALGTMVAGAQSDNPWASESLAGAAAAIRARRVTPSELVRACLERIEIYNPKVECLYHRDA
ncbi:MAG: hypothetical protein JNK87_42325 [Bryobacterales bacterium]|nr:hypothetical protein [Bryobacterales bacterium]